MKTGWLMSATVIAAAVVGVLAQQRPEPRPAYAAAAPESGLKHLQDGAEPAAIERAPSLGGRVLEVIDVAQYTYLRLSAAPGELWAAVSKAKVQVGTDVTISDAARMEHFQSATLKRTFDVIYFGSLGTTDVLSSAALPPGHPAIEGQSEPPPEAAATPVPKIEVARASGAGAHTIGELFEQRAQLAGRVVRVRGQIVKVTPAVLGKTYLRLRDGSGAAPDQRELVVTSQVEARVGDVSTFEGTLQTQVDVGIGFVYPVLLADAKRLTDAAAAASPP